MKENLCAKYGEYMHSDERQANTLTCRTLRSLVHLESFVWGGGGGGGNTNKQKHNMCLRFQPTNNAIESPHAALSLATYIRATCSRSIRSVCFAAPCRCRSTETPSVCASAFGVRLLCVCDEQRTTNTGRQINKHTSQHSQSSRRRVLGTHSIDRLSKLTISVNIHNNKRTHAMFAPKVVCEKKYRKYMHNRNVRTESCLLLRAGFGRSLSYSAAPSSAWVGSIASDDTTHIDCSVGARKQRSQQMENEKIVVRLAAILMANNLRRA
jgi:hypothetical protein